MPDGRAYTLSGKLTSTDAADSEQPADINLRACAAFHGRAALNVDFFRWVGDRIRTQA